MADIQPIPPPPRPRRSDRCKLIISHCIAYAIPTILGLLMVIFLRAIPALMPPEIEIELDQASSLSCLNISTSLVTAQWNISLSLRNTSKLTPVNYTHMKLRLSFDCRLHLSGPSLIPTFTPVNDLSVKVLASALKGGVVTIDVVVKAKWRLHLGPWWVPGFLLSSCMDVTFTIPTDSKGVRII